MRVFIRIELRIIITGTGISVNGGQKRLHPILLRFANPQTQYFLAAGSDDNHIVEGSRSRLDVVAVRADFIENFARGACNQIDIADRIAGDETGDAVFVVKGEGAAPRIAVQPGFPNDFSRGLIERDEPATPDLGRARHGEDDEIFDVAAGPALTARRGLHAAGYARNWYCRNKCAAIRIRRFLASILKRGTFPSLKTSALPVQCREVAI